MFNHIFERITEENKKKADAIGGSLEYGTLEKLSTHIDYFMGGVLFFLEGVKSDKTTFISINFWYFL